MIRPLPIPPQLVGPGPMPANVADGETPVVVETCDSSRRSSIEEPAAEPPVPTSSGILDPMEEDEVTADAETPVPAPPFKLPRIEEAEIPVPSSSSTGPLPSSSTRAPGTPVGDLPGNIPRSPPLPAGLRDFFTESTTITGQRLE